MARRVATRRGQESAIRDQKGKDQTMSRRFPKGTGEFLLHCHKCNKFTLHQRQPGSFAHCIPCNTKPKRQLPPTASGPIIQTAPKQPKATTQRRTKDKPTFADTYACKHCHKPYIRTAPHQRYCTTKCAKHAQEQRSRKRRAAPEAEKRTCEYCHAVYTPHQPHQRFDNKECKRLAKEARRQRTWTHWKPTPRACEHCHSTFTPKHPNNRFCKQECQANDQRERRRLDASALAAKRRRDRSGPHPVFFH
jgi:hypothetical protein